MMDDTSPSACEIAVAYLDAIRLAEAGAANDRAFAIVVNSMLDRAPKGNGADTLSPRFLIDAIEATEVALSVA